MPPDNLFSLEGKCALITGGGSGIGQAIAHGLSDAGAQIIVAGRRQEVLEESLGDRNGAVAPVDLMDPDAPQMLLDQCKRFGLEPNVIVNAAGINIRKSADDVTQQHWDTTLQLNLTAPFFLAQTFVPIMRKKNWGRIINIASLQSERAFANSISYGASKGGIAQLTRAMAEAWSSEGINANAIAPGFFPTDLTASVFADPELSAAHAARTALGRNGVAEDLVGPAVFLASAASRYVTGQILYVDGGYTAK
jgi:NAD(P)-dependent dehydrogenase (short-subunit alcohol dehydrogenase family)